MTDTRPDQPSTDAPSDFVPEEGFYRGLVEEGADVLVLVERSGAMLWVNESAAYTFAMTRGACVGSSFVQLGYLYYWRSNSLDIHLASAELGTGFQ